MSESAPPCAIYVQTCFAGDADTAVRAVGGALAACGGYVLERRAASSTAVEWHVEVRLLAVMELYAQLLGTGLRLSRSSHASLAALCSRQARGSLQSWPGMVLELRLELTVLEATGFGLLGSSHERAA